MSRSLKLALLGLSPLMVPLFLSMSGASRPASAQDSTAESVDAATQDAAANVATPDDTGAQHRDESQKKHAWQLSEPSPPVERIDRQLDNPAGVEIDFSFGQPLKDAMDFVADAHRITIILDEKALQDVGIEPDEQLNQVLSGITLRSALNIMLEPLDLTYVVEDEVLKITTQEVADKSLETRVYDVRALDAAGFDSHQLADAITETLRPNTWPNDAQQLRAPGGGFGPIGPRRSGEREPARQIDTGITAVSGALVVTHNQDMHRRIVALLDQLAVLADRHGED